jgi:hypothetical protein
VFESAKEYTKEILDNFLKAVFLPVKVAVPFVIAFVMLNAGAQIGPAPADFGDVPLIPIFVGVRDLWQFLWMGIALFILWKYSFDALSHDKAGFMGHFTEKIQGIGQNLGSLMAQLPLSVPIIPMPGRAPGETGGAISPLQALHGLSLQRTLSSLRSTGRLPSFRENLGLARSEGTSVTFIQNNPTVINPVIEQLGKADNAEGVTRAMESLRKLPAARTAFGTLNRRQVLEQLLNSPGARETLNEETTKRLRALMEGDVGSVPFNASAEHP